MAFKSEKTIHGRKYFYLEHSFRLYNGTIKRISKILTKEEENENIQTLQKKYQEYFELKEEKAHCAYTLQKYSSDHIFTKETIEKIEKIRLGYKNLIKKITSKQFEDIIDRFTANFTYESNAIEGNSLTLKDVTIIINEGIVLRGKELREVYETINTRKVLEYVFKRKPSITEATIQKIHSMLVENTGITTGYKKLPNFLLGRLTKTTPPELVAEEMKKLLKWYSTEEKMHPLKKIAKFHGLFEKIHPFEDGNGRTGRMIINAMLLKEGYPPLIIRKTQRIKYFHTLEATDNKHSENLQRFILQKYKDTYKKFFEVYAKYI